MFFLCMGTCLERFERTTTSWVATCQYMVENVPSCPPRLLTQTPQHEMASVQNDQYEHSSSNLDAALKRDALRFVTLLQNRFCRWSAPSGPFEL